MMDQFVSDITELWTDVGLGLKPRKHASDEEEQSSGSTKLNIEKARFCPEGGATCEYCKKPLLFGRLESREKMKTGDVINDVKFRKVTPHCHKRNCPQMVTSAA